MQKPNTAVQVVDFNGSEITVDNPLPVSQVGVGANVLVTNLFLETTTNANPSIGTEPAASVIIAGTTDSTFPTSAGPNTNTRALRVGAGTQAQSLAVTIASDQPDIPVSIGSIALPTGAATEATLSSIDGKTAAFGQKNMAFSSPVVLASDQSAVPVTASSLPLPSGASTEATLASINGKFGASLVSFLNSAASTNATSVKGSAGTLRGLVLSNMSDNVPYFKIYNKSTAPNVGTDIPVIVIPIPAFSVYVLSININGIPFSLGISFAITGASGDADTTTVAADHVKSIVTYI